MDDKVKELVESYLHRGWLLGEALIAGHITTEEFLWLVEDVFKGYEVKSLFQLGDFTLHSGSKSNWKIDCDVLTDADWETLACLVAEKVDFAVVHGIPKGGLKFAIALQKYVNPLSAFTLIVDDVLTTGGSMEEARQEYGIERSKGVVLFVRGKCPDWITPIFQLGIGDEVKVESFLPHSPEVKLTSLYYNESWEEPKPDETKPNDGGLLTDEELSRAVWGEWNAEHLRVAKAQRDLTASNCRQKVKEIFEEIEKVKQDIDENGESTEDSTKVVETIYYIGKGRLQALKGG